jgi:murein L,D-transpeptidase YafK
LRRPFTRALLASAAIAAAVMLAGCNADDISPTGRAGAPLSEKTLALMSSKDMDKGSPILVRVFKEESELEVWKQDRSGRYALLKTYPICKWSGDLGPKKREGDRQAPEGFYTITPGQMNPNSNYYLAFNTGFPNTYDRSHGYSGSELMVHGDCSSRGCYAMTDEQIQEIYALARESFFGGQKAFQFEAFPFRMTAMNMARHRNNPNFAFWKMLKEGYDHFEATRQEPKVAVCEQRYVFDADSGGQPFSARGKCPAYRLDPTIASLILDHRRDEQFKMAHLIAEGVATAPPHVGDGGSNPVFATQIAAAQAGYNANGQMVQIASAPGALPHVPNPPGTTIPRPPSSPQVASAAPVSLPRTPPLPRSEPKPAPSVAVALRGSNTDLAAKPKRTAEAEPAAAAQPAKQVATAMPPNEPGSLQTAYSAPPSASLLTGAQPMLPVGTFAGRWSGLR